MDQSQVSTLSVGLNSKRFLTILQNTCYFSGIFSTKKLTGMKLPPVLENLARKRPSEAEINIGLTNCREFLLDTSLFCESKHKNT